jgi:hypothetical protein
MWSVIVLMVVGVLAGARVGTFHVETHPADSRGVLEIVAPIVLEVSEHGKLLGTTKEETRLSIPSGTHVLTLSNRDFEYTFTHRVDIEAGEVRTITLDPRGPAKLNATPWAEVWMNGKKLGETPLVQQLPLGIHDLVFKNPRLGERRVTTTIRANATTSITVAMHKQK